MHQDLPFVSPNNSDDEDGVTNIRGREEADWTIAEKLLGMGQGLPKDDDAIEEEEVVDEVEEEDGEARESCEWEAL